MKWLSSWGKRSMSKQCQHYSLISTTAQHSGLEVELFYEAARYFGMSTLTSFLLRHPHGCSERLIPMLLREASHPAWYLSLARNLRELPPGRLNQMNDNDQSYLPD